MLDRLEFLLSEAFVALRRNWLMTFAAITTSAVALFLLGGLGYVYFRVNQFAGGVSDRFEMRVWLRDDVSKAQISETAKLMRAIPGVREARWVPREIEWQKQRQENPAITQGLDNAFPHSFKVILIDLSGADSVASALRRIPLIDPNGVQYLKAEQQLMDEWLKFLRWMGGGLGSLLLVTSGILIYNAIRLTILARRREIRIMEMVGASRATVRTPFVIEGVVQGATGGVAAAFLILAAQAAVESKMRTLVLAAPLAPFPLLLAIGLLATMGGLFGGLCSILAVREPVRLRPGM